MNTLNLTSIHWRTLQAVEAKGPGTERQVGGTYQALNILYNLGLIDRRDKTIPVVKKAVIYSITEAGRKYLNDQEPA